MCCVLLLPSRSNSRSCRTRSSFTWMLRRHVADFIQQHRAGIGLLEFARLRDVGARERALLVAEQLAFHQVFRNRRAVDFDEWPVFARRMKMNGARNQIFTHAAFARQQHRRARGRHAHDGAEDLLHRGAAAHDVVELVLAPQFFFQLPVLIAQIADFQRLVHHRRQVIERKRLQQEIGRARLHRFDRILHGAERRHHDHRHMRILPPDQLQHLEAGHAGQLEIGQDQIGAVKQRQSFFRRGGFNDIEAGIEQLQFQDAPRH